MAICLLFLQQLNLAGSGTSRKPAGLQDSYEEQQASAASFPSPSNVNAGGQRWDSEASSLCMLSIRGGGSTMRLIQV